MDAPVLQQLCAASLMLLQEKLDGGQQGRGPIVALLARVDLNMEPK